MKLLKSTKEQHSLGGAHILYEIFTYIIYGGCYAGDGCCSVWSFCCYPHYNQFRGKRTIKSHKHLKILQQNATARLK